ncbi:hypothetical protein J2T17_004678 [Paenibacillus mucilaginosus]|uniref:DUF5677 domain-containing protein n=1 Tax=Paenibacillus mucilaginosus TaxID=61624 RepID=UPI003D21B1FC
MPEKIEKINYLKNIIEKTSQHFLREGQPFIILEGHEHVRDIFSLYSKQTNLLSSLLHLLECNFTEESYILLRSQINNHMLIEYLMNDDKSRTRFKEYHDQPIKSEHKFFRDLSFAIRKGWYKRKDFPDLDKKIRDTENELRKLGYNPNDQKSLMPITVAKLAKSEPSLFGIYLTLYRNASKHEHSDPTSLEVYREQVIPESPPTNIFSFNLSKSNFEDEEIILQIATSTYVSCFFHIYQYLSKHYDQLLSSFNKPALFDIFYNLALLSNDEQLIHQVNEIIIKHNPKAASILQTKKARTLYEQ